MTSPQLGLFPARSDDRLAALSPEFILEFENLANAAIAQSDDWLTRSRVARLVQQEEAGKPRPGSSGGGGGVSWRAQPSDATRTVMGMASEWLV